MTGLKKIDLSFLVDFALKTEKAWEAYTQREWKKAQELYEKVLELSSNDSVAKIFIARCKLYEKHPPSKDWDGIYTVSYNE